MTPIEFSTLAAVERRFDGPYPADLLLTGVAYRRVLLGEAETAARFHAARAGRAMAAARWHWTLAQLDREPAHLVEALAADARAERRRATAWRRRAAQLAVRLSALALTPEA